MSLGEFTILIIEDNRVDQEIMARLILREGARAITAHDGETGFNLAYEKIPDLIILDYYLPGENGDKVCEKLKKEERTKRIPILFVTIEKSLDKLIDFLGVGARGYVIKPVKSKQFILDIKHTLRNPRI